MSARPRVDIVIKMNPAKRFISMDLKRCILEVHFIFNKQILA